MPKRPRPSRHSKERLATLAGIAAHQGNGLDAIEIWFADEARIGQKNKITRRWARRGARPSAPQDQRTASTYVSGAVRPREGKGPALVLPFCNNAGMSLHLAEIARMVETGRHAVRPLDQAGWHLSAHIELLAKSRELSMMENVWQFLGGYRLSNRIFVAKDDIVRQCCFRMNRLIEMPWRMMSIDLRDCVYGL